MTSGMAYEKMATVYDALMYDVEYAAWVAYLAAFLREAGVSTVFEAACGTGNITIPLVKNGFSVTAADISADMLAVAAGKARAAGVKASFVVGDMRHIAVHKQVDAVICCCDGVNYLQKTGVQAFLQSAYAALREGGILLFDLSSAYKLTRVIGNNLFYDDGNDVTYFWQNALHEKEGKVCMQLAFFVREADRYRRFDETHVQFIHEEASILHMLRDAGFREACAYGFLTRQAPAENTERIQFIAYK